jgi:anti-sigma factor ChrR (cupin superfamily)
MYQSKVYKDSNGNRQVVGSGGMLDVQSGAIPTGLVLNLRTRATTAEVNAGLVLLPQLLGYKYRIVDLTLIAIGGNAATATSVDIVTTQGGSAARPFVVAVAALTRSAVVKPNSANVTVLADGASFVANDDNTGVYVSKQAAGSSLATATHIDVNLTYVIEAA